MESGRRPARTQTRREVTLLTLALTLIAAALYGPHAIDGGFIGDAWSTRAAYVFSPHPGFFGTVGHFLDLSNIATRPLYAVYRVALNETLGDHMGFWFAWQGASCVLMSLSVYLLLRRLDFAFVDAATIAVLLLIFPAASALSLWTPVIHVSLAISLATFGFLLALLAFEEGSLRRRTLAHSASLALFVASVLLYEAALPLILASALLYRLKVPWPSATARWALDCMVILPLTLTVTRSSDSAGQDQPASHFLSHAERIYERALELLDTVVLPLGDPAWHGLALIALLSAVAGFVAHRLPPGDVARGQLRRWLAVLGAGLIVVALGYSIFVPGIDYYEPLAPGIANRVNAVPAIGWVLILYATVMLAATLALRGLRDSRSLTSGVAVLACAAVAVGWVQSNLRHADAYTDAYLEGQRVLGTIRAAVPAPPPGSTIWTFGQPLEVELGVPVFGNTWDMRDSVALMYEEPTIESYVGFPGTTFECRAGGVVPGGVASYPAVPPGQLGEFGSPYGRTWFIETTTGRVEAIRTPRQCRRASARFERSPPLPGVPAPPPIPAQAG